MPWLKVSHEPQIRPMGECIYSNPVEYLSGMTESRPAVGTRRLPTAVSGFDSRTAAMSSRCLCAPKDAPVDAIYLIRSDLLFGARELSRVRP